MEFEKKVDEIIPPMDYQHRNGFSNIQLINELTHNEKEKLEHILIKKLIFTNDEEIDILIVETLAYLKSKISLPILKDLLTKCSDEMCKLIIATSIYDIDKGSSNMIDIAINSIKKMDNINDAYYVYKLASAFYYLAKFRNTRINHIIKDYTEHKEYLVSYNAKKHLIE